ncbi:MAG: polymer-forming cytoskeletal protein [Bdellovibrionota bacterium]|nr:MAG: polymer-forming cytoskeletal protein [Bdellovibrionota bacterium]
MSSTSTPPPITSTPSGQVEAFLGKGCKVVGNLSFTGPVELDGHIEGEITAKDRLTIGEAAIINAKISGAEIVVRGTVNGDIIASKKLSLRRPAKITGNISSTNLSIEEGVVFEGKCSMNGPAVTSISSASGTGVVKSLAGEKVSASA